ncbi:hypothetical protein OKA04_23755 [Luteolibacter flavescens]|uniref:Squalene cyclase C-terminal domain-containing protein n=1 Tax=Luteolibacter flavescens TaxID=1859460 RepID=A0ABT3FWR8_9BACT|nr:prenyltransferase/squalene oxidase repeat-containing protein [Luteolibacter flavescens]MCW1887774.1 hypothetical protein [Luteolibacter flavescens]
MKTALCLAFASTIALAPAQETNNPYLSLQVEIKQAIARGNAWLAKQQKEDGHWDDAELPAFTALALTAGARDPGRDPKADLPPHIAKGFQWLLKQQKEDGGIYNKGLSVYNTATAVTALTAGGLPEYEPAIVKGRNHLIDQQWDIGQKKETDNPNDGGIGYGSKNDRSDMSNTYLAIEAIALSQKVIEDGKHGDQPDLDWDAAITFLSRCQNLEGGKALPETAESPQNKGGFRYGPAETKAGEDKLPDGRTALRSYGSISYAGLLSMIYAKLGPDDPRIVAVKEWLGKNYTLSENPGMGAQGLFYYYQTMSKALSVANINKFKLADGKEADWRNDLANALLSKQREDGSWTNENARWMESNPVLVTAYCVMSLEQIYYSIPSEP